MCVCIYIYIYILTLVCMYVCTYICSNNLKSMYVVTSIKRLAVVVEGKMSRWIPRENYRYLSLL
jgi:hypothetical protein